MTVRLDIDVRIADAGWRNVRSLRLATERALGAAANHLGRGGEVAILFTSDAEMRRLNKQWRGKDKPTDVLSFPSDDEMPSKIRHLGDIALGLETARADAERMDRPLRAHISHLLVHGFLHLLGYDHETDGDASVMEALEIDILAGLGLPNPYVLEPG